MERAMRIDEVLNQSPPYVDVNLYESDRPLQDAVAANGGAGDASALSDFGKHWGTAEMFDLARAANEHPPELKAFDAKGFRRDAIEFHPAYHQFMSESIAAGLAASTWREDATPMGTPAQVLRAARFYMAAQIETGHLCPVTMTHAAVAALTLERELVGKLMPKITSRRYDPRFRPWWEKRGITLGMGVRTIINMVQLTRLDCAVASAGIMRMALAQAIHHARYRSVFQKHLVDQPMMRAVLADLALEVEAATALVMRLARSFDLGASDPREAARARLLTPAVKYWVCKSASGVIGEAMECLGGNAYVGESVLPRLYREAPVNAIWEGSGNVMCLDVLRAVDREREAAREVLAALAEEAADLSGTRGALAFLEQALSSDNPEAHARAAVEHLALLAATAALGQSAGHRMANLLARTRLEHRHATMYGTAAITEDEARQLIDRAFPTA